MAQVQRLIQEVLKMKQTVYYHGSVYIYRWLGSNTNIVANIGGVKNHPKLGDCDSVRTSPVVSVTTDGVVETKNTIYAPINPISGADTYIKYETGITPKDIYNQRVRFAGAKEEPSIFEEGNIVRYVGGDGSFNFAVLITKVKKDKSTFSGIVISSTRSSYKIGEKSSDWSKDEEYWKLATITVNEGD